MKNKLLILTIVMLKNLYSLPEDPKKKIRQIILFTVIGLFMAPLVSSIVIFVSRLYDSLVSIGEAGVLLSLGIALSTFIIFFFGLFYVMNTFYFSEDIDDLLPLPVKPSHILGAKFIIVIIFEYFTEGLILLPIIIVYGLKSSQGLLYYLYSLLIFLTLPIFPIMLDSIIVMVIMRFSNIAKNKDAFRIISALSAVFLGVGVNMFIQRFMLRKGIEALEIGNNALTNFVSNIFPLSKFGSLGLANSASFEGLWYIVLFLGISALSFYLFTTLGNMLYYKGVAGISISSSRGRKLSSEEFERRTTRSSVLKAYVLKELRILFRTPSFFVNCVLSNFLWPILLIVPMLAQPKETNGLGTLVAMLSIDGIQGGLVAAAFGGMLLVSASNGIAATAISREGPQIDFNKFIPVAYSLQIMAKLSTGVLMGMGAMVSMGIAAVALLKIPITLMLIMSATNLFAIIFSNLVGLLLDLINPKLHWDNEQKAVKQNLNLLIIMGFCMVCGVITAAAGFISRASVGDVVFWLSSIFGVLDVLLAVIVFKKGSRILSRIEF